MKAFFSILFLFIASFTFSQFHPDREYQFTSTAYYVGMPELFSKDALNISHSLIEMNGTVSSHRAIRKYTEFDSYSYDFVNAFTDENGLGKWICSDADYNLGLKHVVYDPKLMLIEFAFKDGTVVLFVDVKRVK
ncbi:MAG TPA: hypothetical protein VHS96_00765 [Bacteroidia bacterium]|nr:hypothetical protein [Bacteroidia bacterium]